MMIESYSLWSSPNDYISQGCATSAILSLSLYYILVSAHDAFVVCFTVISMMKSNLPEISRHYTLTGHVIMMNKFEIACMQAMHDN